MKTKPHAVVLRIAAVLFSVTLATVYVACQSGSGNKDKDPAGDPPSTHDEKFFPGSKSAPFDPKTDTDRNSGTFDNDKPAEEKKEIDPQFLPGSKSLKLTIPPQPKESAEPPRGSIPDPIKDLTKENNK